MHRVPLPSTNFFSFLRGCLTRSKEHRRYLNLHKRSSRKLEAELDILNLIRSRMLFEVSLYGLMTPQQRKFSEKLGQPHLSEWSSSELDGFSKRKTIKIGQLSQPETDVQNLNYIDKMVDKPTECDLRYLELYEQHDNKRGHRIKVEKEHGLIERSVTEMRKNMQRSLFRKSSLPKTQTNEEQSSQENSLVEMKTRVPFLSIQRLTQN